MPFTASAGQLALQDAAQNPIPSQLFAAHRDSLHSGQNRSAVEPDTVARLRQGSPFIWHGHGIRR